ncbi:BNR repeat-containing protein [Aestuariibaculum sp. TT11]|uniref:BNR repeat-containing protein n=1 Tax=Aestuariibaculum sediminum TaxID=2770637 RepID=A0A8J6UBW7_9FLAO|nr:BNR repeat-containing protein [Aestuariibaculum sediminum]
MHGIILVCLNLVLFELGAQNVTSTYVGEGWSKNSVNTVKFRKNAITTHNGYQFTAFYDPESYLVLAKRRLKSSKWLINKTPYRGLAKDAHNSISIAIDGNGFLHVSWDHHNTKLRYAVSKEPYGLVLGNEQEMTGKQEEKVTYPEFYNLSNGNLMFFYRSGESGRGNLVINSYNLANQTWEQIQSNLIDGENKRSAYWQAHVDAKGIIHLSWVWRETWNVETNHDLCYARSRDGGKTWEKSNADIYELPITKSTAEYALKISQNSNLINQTSITTDENGNPFIVSYWNKNNVPQYQLAYLKDSIWQNVNTGFRSESFVLGGGGTKHIPISRPDILIGNEFVAILFRDASLDNKVSMAYTKNIENKRPWSVIHLTNDSVGQWEPNFDLALWHSKKQLHIFLQNVTQIDSEGIADSDASEVKILEVRNLNKLLKS